ncbi:MAG TPA: patatin-like phospholipase family protein [Pseudomonadales bacterium]
MKSFATRLTLMAFTLAVSGCASVYKPQNVAETGVINPDKGYRLTNTHMMDSGDRTLLMLSFSGGGTRAAALSYGVLKELRDTPIKTTSGQPGRLLDEVDYISSVSGGSFTAAYYALNGNDTFKTYENRFLKQSVQGTLIRKLFNPVYWWKSLFTGFDRTEMAVEYYDTYIFKGAKFSDLPHTRTPFIEINATDLNAGMRFSFTQRYFDLICSDLDQLSIARAVTASSAVPLLFPSVVLKNNSSECDISKTPLGEQLAHHPNTASPQAQFLFETMGSYRNEKERPYIHLVDGGISDNIGIRAIFQRLETYGYVPGLNDPFQNFDNVVFLLVNAEVKPRRTIDQTAEKPSLSKTIDAVSAAQIGLANIETLNMLQRGIEKQRAEAIAAGKPPKFHLIQVSFEDVASPSLKDYLNNLPTSLELDSEQVDELIKTGQTLLRESDEFKGLLHELNTN